MKKTSIMKPSEAMAIFRKPPTRMSGGEAERVMRVAAEQYRRTMTDVIMTLRVLADSVKDNGHESEIERDALHDAATAFEAQLKAPL